ncbi:NAD(P)-binding domain-containing protein [Eubacteriales bacterium OttesenSCG-928-K08]|nr:NAD(P)-binding domain-containing protein [Eubacteriales bacterium OttesenSCG-928-K08]
MFKVVSSVIKQRFEKFNIHFPQEWAVTYIKSPYSDDDLIAACKNADFLFLNSTHPASAQVIEACPNLKMIHVEGVGYDKVDVEAAKALGIPVCNNRAVNNGAVAEHTIGLMLAGLRRTAVCDTQVKTEGFGACQQKFMAAGQHELADLHVGLVGIGAIGKEVAIRLKAWGCKISYYDAFRPTPEVEEALDVSYLELDDLIRECDIVSIHVPVLSSTFHMFSTPQFDAMKESALLINTARGEIIDQMALADALEKGKIYGAALDTLYPEPAPAYHPLLNLSPEASSRLTITPHVGGTTDEAFIRMLKNSIKNMLRVANGEQP